MATLKQILKANGFQCESAATYSERWKLRQSGKWIGKSYVRLAIRMYERNASQAVVMISGKKSEIWFGYGNYSAKAPNDEQRARFTALVLKCREAAIQEEIMPLPSKPRKKAPPRPALTDDQKAENKVWRWLGNFTAQGMISKDQRDKDTGGGLYYYRKGKYIRVEDNWNCMAYANIRQCHLDESGLGFTLDTFEEWLKAHDVEKRREKRVKYNPPLYD